MTYIYAASNGDAWYSGKAKGRRTNDNDSDMEPTTIQAVLWIGEKELYYALGAERKSTRETFAEAAEELHIRLLGRPFGGDAESARRVGGGEPSVSSGVAPENGGEGGGREGGEEGLISRASIDNSDSPASKRNAERMQQAVN